MLIFAGLELAIAMYPMAHSLLRSGGIFQLPELRAIMAKLARPPHKICPDRSHA
jgi:hypothetical protein